MTETPTFVEKSYKFSIKTFYKGVVGSIQAVSSITAAITYELTITDGILHINILTAKFFTEF